jgi:PAS domain S-box-containing protein
MTTAPSPRPPRILVVAADEKMRMLIRSAVGVELEYSTFEERRDLEAAAAFAPELLVICTSRRQTQPALVQRARSHPDLAGVPILVAVAAPDEAQRSLNEGADDWVTVGAAPQEIRARVARLLREHPRPTAPGPRTEWLKPILEGMSDGFVVLDRDLRFRFLAEKDRRRLRAADIDPEDFVGKYVWDALPGLHDEGVDRELRAVIGGNEPRSFEIEVAKRWYEVRLCPTADGGLCVLSPDITERKLAEQALSESESRFRHLAEAVPHIVFIAGAGGKLDYVNEQWLAFSGLTPEETIADPLAVIHPDSSSTLEHAREVVRGGRAVQVELRLRDRGGAYRWFLVRAVPIPGDDGNPARWFGTCTDIEDEKLVQSRLTQALELRNDFLSIASHELKTPLAAVILHLHGAQRIAHREGTDFAVRERLDRAALAATRLDSLIDQLLDMSRLGQGPLKLTRTRTDLAALVREVVARQTELLSRSPSTIAIRAPPSLFGLWDGERVDQVVTNIIANAMKYGAGSPVEVELEEADGVAVLRVTDHGIGIAYDQQGRIFERFERAVTWHEYGGFGIGLWLSRQIVEELGGRIEVKSAPGEGSTFTVTLPIQPPVEATATVH